MHVPSHANAAAAIDAGRWFAAACCLATKVRSPGIFRDVSAALVVAVAVFLAGPRDARGRGRQGGLSGRGREAGPRAADEAAWTAASSIASVDKARNRRAGRPCAQGRGCGGGEKGRGGGARRRTRVRATPAGRDAALRGRRSRGQSRGTSPRPTK